MYGYRCWPCETTGHAGGEPDARLGSSPGKHSSSNAVNNFSQLQLTNRLCLLLEDGAGQGPLYLDLVPVAVQGLASLQRENIHKTPTHLVSFSGWILNLVSSLCLQHEEGTNAASLLNSDELFQQYRRNLLGLPQAKTKLFYCKVFY